LSEARKPVHYFDHLLLQNAEVTDPEAIQTILAHLRQRAPPDAVHRQRPEQWPEKKVSLPLPDGLNFARALFPKSTEKHVG
jgi:hypothetical protein